MSNLNVYGTNSKSPILFYYHLLADRENCTILKKDVGYPLCKWYHGRSEKQFKKNVVLTTTIYNCNFCSQNFAHNNFSVSQFSPETPSDLQPTH